MLTLWQLDITARSTSTVFNVFLLYILNYVVFLHYCQAQPSFNVSLAEAVVVILSINPTTHQTTHPPLSRQVVLRLILDKL